MQRREVDLVILSDVHWGTYRCYAHASTASIPPRARFRTDDGDGDHAINSKLDIDLLLAAFRAEGWDLLLNVFALAKPLAPARFSVKLSYTCASKTQGRI